jgi:hypothetical protein
MRKIYVIILMSINLLGWEVTTHRAIEKEALKNADNLGVIVSDGAVNENFIHEVFEGYDRTYIDYLINGEEDGVSNDALAQTFNQANADFKDLIEAGSMLEDAQWPRALTAAEGRFLKHFYDPQDGADGLWGHENTLVWATQSSRNQYNYQNAIQYFAKGFSEAGESERRKYQAKMFVSVGHMMQKSNHAMQEV